jgi:hypothetical protein
VDVEALAAKLADQIEVGRKNGCDEGYSNHFKGLRQGILEGLHWVLEQLDHEIVVNPRRGR